MTPSNPRPARTAQVDTVVIAAQTATTRRLRVARPRRGRARSRLAEAVTRGYTAHERAFFTSGDDRPTPARTPWHAAALNAAAASDAQFAARLVSRARHRQALAAVLVGSAIAIAVSALVFKHSVAPHSAPSAPKPRDTAPQSAAPRNATQPARDDTAEAPASAAAFPPTAVATATALSPPDTPVPAPSSVIEWLATAQYPQALEGYRRLARSDARNPAYAAAAAILERKLAQRCAQRVESGGAPCGAAQP